MDKYNHAYYRRKEMKSTVLFSLGRQILPGRKTRRAFASAPFPIFPYLLTWINFKYFFWSGNGVD